MTEEEILAAVRSFGETQAPAMRDILIARAKRVVTQYTTAPVRVHYRDRLYQIPANYYTAFGREMFAKQINPQGEYETKGGESIGGWSIFLPDFSGYTTGNWIDIQDKNRIVVSLYTVDSSDLPPERLLRNASETGLINLPGQTVFGGLTEFTSRIDLFTFYYAEPSARTSLWLRCTRPPLAHCNATAFQHEGKELTHF